MPSLYAKCDLCLRPISSTELIEGGYKHYDFRLFRHKLQELGWEIGSDRLPVEICPQCKVKHMNPNKQPILNSAGWPIADMAAGSPWVYNAKVIKVVDGDTIDCIIDHGMSIKSVQRIRLNRINAPERFTEEGEAAMAFLSAMLSNEEVRLHTMRDKREKYGRYIAEVIIDSTNVSDLLVNEGHAVYQSY